MRIIITTDDDVRVADVEILKDGWESDSNKMKLWRILSHEIPRAIKEESGDLEPASELKIKYTLEVE